MECQKPKCNKERRKPEKRNERLKLDVVEIRWGNGRTAGHYNVVIIKSNKRTTSIEWIVSKKQDPLLLPA